MAAEATARPGAAAAAPEERSLKWRPARGAASALAALGGGGAARLAPTRPHGRRAGARRAREGEGNPGGERGGARRGGRKDRGGRGQGRGPGGVREHVSPGAWDWRDSIPSPADILIYVVATEASDTGGRRRPGLLVTSLQVVVTQLTVLSPETRQGNSDKGIAGW